MSIQAAPTGEGELRSAYAVRSSDFDEVWMLAAEISGPGFGGETGVWAVNNIDEPQTIYVADALAAEFSDWGTGPIRPTDNGNAVGISGSPTRTT